MQWTDYLETIMPPWLWQTWGKRLVYGMFGIPADAMTQAAANAAKSHLILEPECPTDALILIGNERNLPRYPIDTDGYYQARLKGAWDLWDLAGTKTGILMGLRQLDPFPNIYIIEVEFGNFVVFIDQPHPFVFQDWGDFTWGEVYWSGSQDVLYVRDIIKRLKPVHVTCSSITIIISGFVWGLPSPEHNWGSFTWGGELAQLTGV